MGAPCRTNEPSGSAVAVIVKLNDSDRSGVLCMSLPWFGCPPSGPGQPVVRGVGWVGVRNIILGRNSVKE